MPTQFACVGPGTRTATTTDWSRYGTYSRAIPAMQEEAAALIAELVFAGS